ncbi:MAG: hypothetical protein KKA16_06620 [Alphaproteobacteria bacterium]|nr:hypothetical protein [Alphaproteobacteria bacterium]MBU2379565.1 hypothetical protein [Alphaproteobacteria bacterium]
MTIDTQWLPAIAGLVGGGIIITIWRVFEHGWAKDIARERQAQAEWERTHPAE